MEILVAAAERGMTSAGFVNVKGESRSAGDRLEIAVRGDCPCGLGRSGAGMVVSPDLILGGNAERIVEDRIHAISVRHIEVDKAEGRWA